MQLLDQLEQERLKLQQHVQELQLALQQGQRQHERDLLQIEQFLAQRGEEQLALQREALDTRIRTIEQDAARERQESSRRVLGEL